MHLFEGYRVRNAHWYEEYRVYGETICDKTGLTKEQLREVVEMFMEYGILPDMYENY